MNIGLIFWIFNTFLNYIYYYLIHDVINITATWGVTLICDDLSFIVSLNSPTESLFLIEHGLFYNV